MYDNPLFWEHGVFLQPQHFQVSQLQELRRLSSTLTLLNPWLWGVRRMEVNEQALSNFVAEITNLEIFLPGGEHVSIPGNGILEPRSFADSWPNTEIPLTIWLAIAEYREQGGNALREAEGRNASGKRRFFAPSEPVTIPDLLGDGPAMDVPVMKYSFHLLLDGDDSDGYWKMPLLRLVRDGERIRLDSTFTPACVDINGFPSLHLIAKNVRDSLLSRCRQLGEYKPSLSEAGRGTQTDPVLLGVLGALSRNLPALNLLLQAPSAHPWSVYGVLCRLIGELSVYTPGLSPLGESIQDNAALPAYEHADPYPSFAAASSVILRIADSLVMGPACTVPFAEKTDGVFTAEIPLQVRSHRYAFWLLLRTSTKESVAQTMASMGRLIPDAKLNGILARALPGVRMTFCETPPPGLPRRSDTLYYLVDQGDPLWGEALADGRLSLFLPGSPEDLAAQIAVVER